MATTITDFLTALAIRLSKSSITSTSSPTINEVYQVLFESCEWTSKLCAQYESDIGRKLGSISLSDGVSTYRDFCDDIIVPAKKGWLEETYTRYEINLCEQEDIIDYSPNSSAETQPEKYYMGTNGEITFLQTPDDSYTAKIPYWYHQSKISAESYDISGATKANPCVITTSATHGFQTGDRIKITDVSGMTELNDNWYTITKVSSTTFSLDGIDSTSYTTYTSGGKANTVVPFNGIFDNVLIEACSIRFQNIREYQQAFETSWLKFLIDEVTKIILMRRGRTAEVSR